MVRDAQVSRSEFEKLLSEYPYTFLLGRRTDFGREGEWIRFCHRAIDAAEEAIGGNDKDTIIAEVIPVIKEITKKIYSRSRSKPKPMKAVTYYVPEREEHSELWVMSKHPLNAAQIYHIISSANNA